MVLHELGIPAICPNSESTSIPNGMLKELRKRFQYIVSFYDYDNAGIQAALKLDIPYMFLFKSKDISDFYKKYGKHLSYRMLKQILSKSYHRYEKFLFHAYSKREGNGNTLVIGREDDIPF
jgi:DNA primase